jgi:hypothetical protein
VTTIARGEVTRLSAASAVSMDKKKDESQKREGRVRSYSLIFFLIAHTDIYSGADHE